MSSKFQFISNLELPLVGHNEDWLTNTWVYITTALIGALTGLTSIKYYFTGYEFGDAATIVFNYGMLYTIAVWVGCTACAFYNIPDVKRATARTIFNLIAVALTFYICAALAVITVIALIVLFVLMAIAFGGSGRSRSGSSSSSASDTVYDGEGNIHYVTSSNGNYIQDTDGNTMRREPDGTYRNLHND